MTETTITNPGKVYLNSKIRGKLGLKEGDKVKVQLEDDKKAVLIQKTN